jgi:hypothetical protein
MSVSVFAGRIGAALTVAIGAAKLAPLFVSNMFVLFAGAGGAVAVAGGGAEAAFGHWIDRLHLNASYKCEEWNVNLFCINGFSIFSASLTPKLFREYVCRYKLGRSIRIFLFTSLVDHSEAPQTCLKFTEVFS